MNVVCYGHAPDKMFHNAWAKMRKTNPDWGLELHRSLVSFASRLRQPVRNIAAVLLYIAYKKNLSDLLVVRSLLHDLPIVILLNDQEPETLRLSHELRPRVIIYTCWRVEDICAVLQRCINRSLSREEAWTAAARISVSSEEL